MFHARDLDDTPTFSSSWMELTCFCNPPLFVAIWSFWCFPLSPKCSLNFFPMSSTHFIFPAVSVSQRMPEGLVIHVHPCRHLVACAALVSHTMKAVAKRSSESGQSCSHPCLTSANSRDTCGAKQPLVPRFLKKKKTVHDAGDVRVKTKNGGRGQGLSDVDAVNRFGEAFADRNEVVVRLLSGERGGDLPMHNYQRWTSVPLPNTFTQSTNDRRCANAMGLKPAVSFGMMQKPASRPDLRHLCLA